MLSPVFDTNHYCYYLVARFIFGKGSSDACVPPNVLLQEEPQNVFVTRSVANMVVENDANQMAALEYAVDMLQVKHIIVCGEYDCGAVLAASNNAIGYYLDAPALNFWVQEIRDISAKHSNELDAISDANARKRRLVELNVIRQCVNVLKCNVVQNRRKASMARGT
jgi:carbonic anhydrase